MHLENCILLIWKINNIYSYSFGLNNKGKTILKKLQEEFPYKVEVRNMLLVTIVT